MKSVSTRSVVYLLRSGQAGLADPVLHSVTSLRPVNLACLQSNQTSVRSAIKTHLRILTSSNVVLDAFVFRLSVLLYRV